jgi:hypothetical protein
MTKPALRWLALIIALTMAGFGFRAAASSRVMGRLCVQPQEEGSWRNSDPNTRSLTRIDLRFVCQDQILNGEPYPPGSPWYVHIFGKCSPTDCDWAEVGADNLNSGHIYAFHNQGFARRHVYARMSQYRPGQLWVWTWTNFTDPNRSDYGVHNWFIRQ